MPRYRPRSIVSLILIGFAVVLTPFIAAVITSIVQLDRLARSNQTAVLEARRATDESRVLVDQVTEMQRALGQYAVSGDRDFYTIYLDRREGFREALGNLAGLDLRGLDPARLAAIADGETNFFRDLGGNAGTRPEGRTWDEATAQLRVLAQQSREIRDLSDALIERQSNDATERAAAVQRTLLMLTAAAVPVTIVLIVLFTILISRPMSALGRAIRRLGGGSQTDPIVVTGPQDIEELGRELDLLRRRIESLEAQKANFLRHISHELKTPLTTIREGSELLTESLGDDMPEEAEIARLMRANGLHLQNLIEDLLQFARTQEVGGDLELAPDTSLSAIVERIVAAQTVVAEARDITIVRRLEPVAVIGDPRKLASVVDNLLTNAIKFTPTNGRIIIALAARDGWAVLDFRDSGPGIDPAERTAIFEPFSQGRAEYQSSVKGTGLGLSIAKEYVEAHEGTIEALECDGGAHFRVTLPLAGPGAYARE